LWTRLLPKVGTAHGVLRVIALDGGLHHRRARVIDRVHGHTANRRPNPFTRPSSLAVRFVLVIEIADLS